MPRTARTPDFLHLHANNARRVRNLETGVHPMAAHTDYTDTIPPTIFPKGTGGPGSDHLDPAGAITPDWPQYQKRSGIASLIGRLIITAPQASDLQDGHGARWGTLPEAMRPTLNHVALVYAAVAPYVTRIAIYTNGELAIGGGALPADVNPIIYLDGVNWPTI